MYRSYQKYQSVIRFRVLQKEVIVLTHCPHYKEHTIWVYYVYQEYIKYNNSSTTEYFRMESNSFLVNSSTGKEVNLNNSLIVGSFLYEFCIVDARSLNTRAAMLKHEYSLHF